MPGSRVHWKISMPRGAGSGWILKGAFAAGTLYRWRRWAAGDLEDIVMKRNGFLRREE